VTRGCARAAHTQGPAIAVYVLLGCDRAGRGGREQRSAAREGAAGMSSCGGCQPRFVRCGALSSSAAHCSSSLEHRAERRSRAAGRDLAWRPGQDGAVVSGRPA
jgi:hypothetical protein